MMTEIITALVAAPLGVYLVVRLGSAAFFKSKSQFDLKGKHHG